MSRGSHMDMAMAAGLLGLQQQGGVAGSFALALVMYTGRPWSLPTGRTLDAARKAAARYRLSEDLAIFLPPEPGRLSARSRKDGYTSLVISLKQLDALEGEARAKAIADVKALLGASGAA